MRVALGVAYAVPPAALLDLEHAVLRYVAAIALVFSPVLLANIAFSREFRDAREATRALGWNLLGAVAGGGLEYLSLRIGYRNLLPIAAACYLIAWLLFARRARSSATS